MQESEIKFEKVEIEMPQAVSEVRKVITEQSVQKRGVF